MNIIIQFLDWLSYIDLYPFYPAWNVTGVALFCLWMFVAFIHLRPKLGILKGGLFAFFFSFMWISLVDEIAIFLSMKMLLTQEMGWQPINFVSRWGWKFFFIYWCLKLASKYELINREIRITVTTMYMLALYWLYYFLYHYRLFFPYTFRSWFMTPYPRWFVFATGHLSGWTFSTIIFISIWYFVNPPEDFLMKYGMGETYMLYALKRLLNKLKAKYNMKFVNELGDFSASEDFPDRDWKRNKPVSGFDLVVAYKGTPETVGEITRSIDWASKVLLISSNPYTLGKLSQKLIGLGDDIFWATVKNLKKIANDSGLIVLESGYYDCPPWFDHSSRVIAPTRKLGIDMGLCRELQFFEWFNNPIWSHHCYVLAEVAI